MDDILISIITQLVYAAITFAMGYSWNKSRNLASIQKNVVNGIAILLLAELRKIHAKTTKLGYITYDEEESAEEIYSIFSKLDDNRQGMVIIHDLRKLPKREVENYEKMVTRDIPKTR